MSKSNTTICSAKNCYSSLVTHPNKSFFGFPSNIALCKKWLENCGRTDLNLYQVSKHSHWKLCEDHFEDAWFTDKSKKVLKRKISPVPTIFVNNINSLLSQGMEPEFVGDDSTPNPENPYNLQLAEEGDDVIDYSLGDQSAASSHTKPLLKSIAFNTESLKETTLDFTSHKELKNIHRMCRFCLSDVFLNHVDMFSQTDDAKDIRKISKIVLQRKVSIDDGMPRKVCQHCIIDLKTCWKLIEQFQNADLYLRSITKSSLLLESDNVSEMRIDCPFDQGGDPPSLEDL